MIHPNDIEFSVRGSIIQEMKKSVIVPNSISDMLQSALNPSVISDKNKSALIPAPNRIVE